MYPWVGSKASDLDLTSSEDTLPDLLTTLRGLYIGELIEVYGDDLYL